MGLMKIIVFVLMGFFIQRLELDTIDKIILGACLVAAYALGLIRTQRNDPWMLIDFNELTRQKIEKATTAHSEGAAGLPNREGDNEGQAGVDETKHN